MTFTPKYTITDSLLANIKRVNALVSELNHRRFSNTILYELERTAREVSSFASTSIEGNPLPLTDVKRILKTTPRNIRQSEQEILNYNAALEKLNQDLQNGPLPMSLDLILGVHRQVMDKLLSPGQTGALRVEPVFVNDPRTGQTQYLPPDHPDVNPLITGLVTFVGLEQGRIDPLIIAGIFHREFVLIHPFIDGNGRTCRLTTKILLAQMGLNTFNLFSFENYYNKNVTRYFQTVGASGNYYELADKIDFTTWLEYFTEGLIDELLRVQKILPVTAVSPETELKLHHQAILDFIKDRGYIADRDYAKLTGRAKATRVLDFQKLIDLELIQREGRGKATYYKLIGKI